IQLQEALVDGKAAYPAATSLPQTGFTFKVDGHGRHKLHLRFGVPLSDESGYRDFHFTIPEVPQSELKVIVPEGAKYLHAVLARGAQNLRMNGKGVTLQAELGSVSTVEVHGREEGRGDN